MKKKINHALIMAAGRGIRMMPLTKNFPKAMTPLLSSTLIANSIKNLKKQVKNIHITVGYKAEMLSSYVISKNVSSVINSKKKGNSWWIYNSLISNIDEPILVLTCDNIVNINFLPYFEEFNKLTNCECLLVPALPVKNINGDYIFNNHQGLVKKISRNKKNKYYASGIQILNPKKLSLKKKYNDFSLLWKNLINENSLYVSKKIVKDWYSIDTIDHLNLFEKR